MQRKNLLLCSIVASILATGSAISAQAVFLKSRNPASPIDDHTARRVGDVLTIKVVEAHKVKNEDKVNRTQSNNLSARLEEYTLSRDTFHTNILPKFDVRTAKDQIGEAKQEKDSSLTARLAVVVVDVQANGNLVIAGTRVVVIDDETKTLRISGLVRQLDVTSDNTVASSQVADARISLTSEGGNARYVTKGPVAAFFDTLIWTLWPF